MFFNITIDSYILIINSSGHISRSGIIRSKGINTLKFLDKYSGRLPDTYYQLDFLKASSSEESSISI